MKKIALVLLSVFSLVAPVIRENTLKMAKSDDEPQGNLLINRIKEDDDDLKIFFLENGIRDENGIVPVGDDGYHIIEGSLDSSNYMNCSDGAIIVYKDFQMLIDCGLGLDQMSLGQYVETQQQKIIKTGAEQVISIMNQIRTDDVWDMMVFTHQDFDHICGAAPIINHSLNTNDFSIKEIYDFAYANNQGDAVYYEWDGVTVLQEYKTAMNSYVSHGGKHVSVSSFFYEASQDDQAKQNDKEEFDIYSTGVKKISNDLSIHFLKNKYMVNRTKSSDINNSSVCLCIEYKGQKMLFTGDLEEAGINSLVNQYYDYLKDGVTFFKAGHHGSGNANTVNLIDLIRPQYVVVSAVADTVQYKFSSEVNRFPSAASMINFFRYTDYIFIPSLAKNSSASGREVVINYKPLYGDILLIFNGNDYETDVQTSYLPEGIENGDDISIYNSKWFLNNRSPYYSVYTFEDDSDTSMMSNCTLYKFGHYDILVDCGTVDFNHVSTDLIDDIRHYVVDKRIEYLVCTSSKKEHISQLVGTITNGVLDNNGILSTFMIDHLIDSDTVISKDSDDYPFYKNYKQLVSQKVKEHLYAPVKDEIVMSLKHFEGEGKDLKLNVIKTPSSENKDDYSLCTVITFLNQKSLLMSDLESADYLVKNHKDLISNAQLFRPSQAKSGKANPSKLLEVVKPKTITIGAPVNCRQLNFGDDKYISKLLASVPSGLRAYLTSYFDYNGRKRIVNNDFAYRYYLEKEDSVVTRMIQAYEESEATAEKRSGEKEIPIKKEIPATEINSNLLNLIYRY